MMSTSQQMNGIQRIYLPRSIQLWSTTESCPSTDPTVNLLRFGSVFDWALNAPSFKSQLMSQVDPSYCGTYILYMLRLYSESVFKWRTVFCYMHHLDKYINKPIHFTAFSGEPYVITHEISASLKRIWYSAIISKTRIHRVAMQFL